MIRTLLASVALLAAGAARAEAPKLLVVISVDQFSADLFAEYRSHFTGGLKRLNAGVVFPSGYQSHAATETCPGHATILTGVHPSRAGIIANNWVDQSIARADKTVYCAEDETQGASSKAADYVPSPIHLRVPTLGDWMKDANPASRVVAVAGKDRAALMMGGHKTDAVWFLSAKDFGRFETLAGRPSSPLADVANARIAAALAKPRPDMPLSPFCAARAQPVAIGEQKIIGTGRFARPAGDKRMFRASPESDAATLGLAESLIADMKLGRGAATDLIAIGVSATDYVGHTYGTAGAEMCVQLDALDAGLGALFAKLDKAKIDYAVALTADHGGHDAPERNRQDALPDAARVDAKPLAAIGGDVAKAMGLTGSVLVAAEAAGDVWVSNAVPPASKAEALARTKAAFLADRQIAAVFTAEELKAVPIATMPPETWSLAERARASFDPARSGDLIVMLKPRVTPIPTEVAAGGSYIATHGSPWDYDRRVPILFWRKGLVPFEQPNSIETVDIAPTLAALIGMTIPAGEMDGICRDLIAGAGSSCL
jgi:predicted AlkP superfamily pyrophosphatase or phosphodiesterase